MLRTEICVRKLFPDAVLPAYAHPGDAGMDIVAHEDAVIAPGETALIGTGIAIELPEGLEAQVRPRSGLALHHGITVLNSPGTVDSNFRGEIKVLLINHGKQPFAVEKGMRMAQMVIVPYATVTWKPVTSLDDSDRGTAGYGSTGV